MSKLPENKPEPRVTLRLVDPDVSPEAPLEERMNLEATREVHKKLREAGKTPAFMKGALEAIGLAAPTPQDIEWVTQMRATGCAVCGNCRHFRYEEGQTCLERGGAHSIIERIGSAARHLGDWRRYGVCDAKDRTLVAFEAPSWSCELYSDRSKAPFGRILGGVWKRLSEI